MKLFGLACVLGIEPDRSQLAFSIEHVQTFRRPVQKMLVPAYHWYPGSPWKAAYPWSAGALWPSSQKQDVRMDP